MILFDKYLNHENKLGIKPFPFAVIDNYLDEFHFKELVKELDSLKPELQTSFSSSLEEKIIYKNLS